MKHLAILFVAIVTMANGFSASVRQGRYSSALSSTSDDLDFMASLKTRLAQVSDQETKLPLVVLDSMLPRQVLKIGVTNRVFMELVRSRLSQEEPYFGMMGMARLNTGEQVHLKAGVQVDIVGKPIVEKDRIKLELKANRLFRIVDSSVKTNEGGWTEARVEFLDNMDDEIDEAELARATKEADQFPALVEEWVALARQRERSEGQIDQLLKDLGELPANPSDRAMWVGALINPIPAMGVAFEIRPSLLTARTPEQRVDAALKGITRSIQHMSGEKPLL